MASRAALLLVVLASTAHAGGKRDLDPDTEVARKHFAAGSEHYRAGEYELALKEFETSRRAKALPALDYNIGRCLDRLERYSDAVAAYRRYVDAMPDAADAPEVKARIRELQDRLAAEHPPVVEAALAKPPEPAPKKRRPRWVWGVVGAVAGVVVITAVGVGVGLGTSSSSHPAATVDTWPDLNLR
jgi:tetratricopeptide (TPR) repeat protein